MRWLFWICAATVVYTFVLYPVVLLFLAGVTQLSRDLRFGLSRGERRKRWRSAVYPKVSLVFAAHNEAVVIRQKMENCKSIQYPADQLEILIGCDSCTDETADLARAAGLPNVSVYEFTERRGKPGVLNCLVPRATGELVIFCDANTMFQPDTVASVVRHFEEPGVGGVCGELRLRAAGGKPSCEGFYWRYETLLKFLESRLNMLVGGNGAVLGIRRELFAPVPANGIIDDFLIAMHVRSTGSRVVYDPEAIAWEEVAPNVRHEFRRRVRIGAGNFYALLHTWRLLNPAAGWVAFAYWSHKICRWLVPMAILGSLAAAIGLARQPLYAASAALILCSFGLGWIGYRLDLREQYRAQFSIPYYFLSMNLALFLGFLRFLRGQQSTVWSPTQRKAAGVPAPAQSAVVAEPVSAKKAHV